MVWHEKAKDHVKKPKNVVSYLLAVPTSLAGAYGGYEFYRDYELRGVNQQVLQCEIQEHRTFHEEGKEVDFECWRIVLEHAGLESPRRGFLKNPGKNE